MLLIYSVFSVTIGSHFKLKSLGNWFCLSCFCTKPLFLTPLFLSTFISQSQSLILDRCGVTLLVAMFLMGRGHKVSLPFMKRLQIIFSVMCGKVDLKPGFSVVYCDT